jgi:hypothetical protein
MYPDNRRAQRVIVVKLIAVTHVRLQRLEERLRVRVVIHPSWPIHAAVKPGTVQYPLEGIAKILHATIAVKERATGRACDSPARV